MDIADGRGRGPNGEEKKKGKAKKKLSSEAKLQRRIQRKLYRDFRTCLNESGFSHLRAEAGKLAETWHMLLPLGSAWTDAVAQDHWTSLPPSK